MLKRVGLLSPCPHTHHLDTPENLMQAALPVRISYRDSSEANRVLVHVQSRDAVRGVDGADLLPHNLNSANAGTYPDIFYDTTRSRPARPRAIYRDAHTEESSCSKGKKERLILLT